MNKSRLIATTSLSAMLVITAACSSNKVSQTSAVESSGDGKGTTPPAQAAKKADMAMVRFVNATTDSKDLMFGDTTSFDGVGSRDITAYKELPAERHDFKLFAKGDKANALATNSEGLTAGKHYTILAVMEKSGKVALDPVADELTPPTPGLAKVRVINLAPGTKNVDLYAGNNKDALISGAGPDQPSIYKEVAPSGGELEVRNSSNKKDAEPVKDVDFKAGKLYTILVFQDKKGKLKVKTVEDEFTAAPNGTNS